MFPEAKDPMVVSDVEAGMWLSAAAARLLFFIPVNSDVILVIVICPVHI